eukprot:UN20249
MSGRSWFHPPTCFLQNVWIEISYESFFTHLKKFHLKNRGFVRIRYSNRIFGSIFQNPKFFTFPDIYSDWCVERSQFSLTQRTWFDGPSRYIVNVRKVRRRFYD